MNFENIIPKLLRMAITERDTAAAPAAFDAPDNDNSGEYARIVAGAFFKANLDVSAWDANGATEWDALIASNDLYIVGPCTGQMPDPSVNTGKGYGFLEMRKKNHSYDIQYEHEQVDANLGMYDNIGSQNGVWSFMPVFEDLTGYLFLSQNLAPVPVMVNARPVSLSDELNDNRVLRVNVQFKSQRLAYPLANLTPANFKLN